MNSDWGDVRWLKSVSFEFVRDGMILLRRLQYYGWLFDCARFVCLFVYDRVSIGGRDRSKSETITIIRIERVSNRGRYVCFVHSCSRPSLNRSVRIHRHAISRILGFAWRRPRAWLRWECRGSTRCTCLRPLCRVAFRLWTLWRCLFRFGVRLSIGLRISFDRAKRIRRIRAFCRRSTVRCTCVRLSILCDRIRASCCPSIRHDTRDCPARRTRQTQRFPPWRRCLRNATNPRRPIGPFPRASSLPSTTLRITSHPARFLIPLHATYHSSILR